MESRRNSYCRFAWTLALAALFIGLPHPARADFIPGRLYVSGVHLQNCGQEASRLYEFDPATGQSRVFMELPCNGFIDMDFTADGRLLGANISPQGFNTLWEVRSETDASIRIPHGQGLRAVGDIDIAPNGDLFAMNRAFPSYDVSRFPNALGPGQVVRANLGDWGAIAVANNSEDVYFGEYSSNVLQRITAEGDVQTVATLPTESLVRSMVTASNGDIYVRATMGLFRVSAGSFEPEYLGPFGGRAMTISPDGSTLFLVGGYFQGLNLHSLDLISGETRLLGTIPGFRDSYAPQGLALYVPGPSAVIGLGCLALLGWRSRLICVFKNRKQEMNWT